MKFYETYIIFSKIYVSSKQKHSIDDVSSADINIKAEPKDNGAQYRCEAHNSAASSPVSVSTTLIVHFPPEEVQVQNMFLL